MAIHERNREVLSEKDDGATIREKQVESLVMLQIRWYMD